MCPGAVYRESHNQVDGIVYRNVCTQYGLEEVAVAVDSNVKTKEHKKMEMQHL